jgi:hypothetical protein
MRIDAEVFRLPPEGEGAELADLRAARIPIVITGTLEDPKVRVDLGSMVRERARSEVREQVEERTEELRKRATDRLKDLLNR